MQSITLIEMHGVWQRILRVSVYRTNPGNYVVPMKCLLADSIEIRISNARAAEFMETFILTSAAAVFV